MKTSRHQLASRNLPLGLRVIASALIPMILTSGSLPLIAAAEVTASPTPVSQPSQTPPAKQQARPAPDVKVNRTVPQVQPPSAAPVFSNPPVDADFFHLHVFMEPLVVIGGTTTPDEDAALAAAVTTFAQAGDAEKTAPLTGFLSQYPNSAWKASLLTNLGILYRRTGHWTKALAAWEEAWKLSKEATTQPATGIADRAAGELTTLNARLGRYDRLEKLMTELDKRTMHGTGAAKVAGAREGLWTMRNKPEQAFLCGPLALGCIWALQHPGGLANEKLLKAKSTLKGISLNNVCVLANDAGMSYQMAKREPGARIITPAVVNWKVGHYAAIVKEEKGKYLVEDPTFTDNIWITAQTLDEEASGYFLVPQGQLPQGWSAVNAKEGKTVWGKGAPPQKTPPPPPPPQKKPPCGMTAYSVDPNRLNLMLSDSPEGYTPPVGPSVRLRVSYSQLDQPPVSVPTYSNLGPQWSFNWLAYIVDDPGNQNTSSYGPAGGTLTYSGYVSTGTESGAFAMQRESYAVLVRTSGSSYEADFPDGSKQIYGLSDGAIPQKIFMTASIDPAGNQLTYNYDANFRLTSVVDAIGQVTMLSYVSGTGTDTTNPGFYLISQVTDPFGRSTSFTYNASWQLASITDTIGITSSYTYGSGDYINSLTTPYGTTTFASTISGIVFSVMATDPLGGTELYKYQNQNGPVPDANGPVPPQSAIATYASADSDRNTYYWSKAAYAQGATVQNAKILHWATTNNNGTVSPVISDVLESVKPALESRKFYNYTAQPEPYISGSNNLPLKVARVLDDGSTQLYQYDYNSIGKVTKMVDPLGRTTTYKYDTNNIDILAVYQENAAGASTDSYGQNADLLASYTYNSQHLPLTKTDASGQTTTCTYNSAGQPLTVTDAKNETTTYAYNANGYLQSVTGAVAGAVTSYTYDGYGRVRTVTDSEGYTVTTDYDAADRPVQKTYPDGTTEQITYNLLDAEWLQDRLGRKTHVFHDALQHMVAVQDPLLRMTQYEYCTCGALEAIIDPAGNRTSFIRDVEARVSIKAFSDGTTITNTYENSTSRLKAATDAIGQTTNYSYNIDSTLAQVSYANAQNATPGVSFTYDPVYNRVASMADGTGTTTYGYNTIAGTPALGAGRMASVTGPLANSTIAYGYDQLGRVVNHSINGTANTVSTAFDSLGRVTSGSNVLGTFNYSYVDETARLSSVSIPNGQTVNYEYYGNTGDERLQEIKNLDPSSNMMSQFDYTYNAVGNITSWQQNNSGLTAAETYGLTYDSANQLTGAALTASGSSAPLSNYAYGYDKAGNRTEEQIGSATTSSTYNGLNQLVSQSPGGVTHFTGNLNEWATVTVGGNVASVTSTVTASGTTYSFDGTANLATGTNTVPITATVSSGTNTATNTYQVVVPSGTGRALTYDLLGNLVNDGTNNYQWDAANRLIKIWYGAAGSSASTAMTYDGAGHRVAIVEQDASGNATCTRNFVWYPNASQPAEERDANNNVTKRFYSQGEQISGASYFYMKDHLGSIREMTDGTGAIHARYSYDLWGRLTKVSGDMDADFAYAGYYNHLPSGLYLTLNRAYSPNLGRWISRDPLRNAERRQGPNLYAYVDNNPISLIDPDGHNWMGFLVGAANLLNNATAWAQGNVQDLGNDFPEECVQVANWGAQEAEANPVAAEAVVIILVL